MDPNEHSDAIFDRVEAYLSGQLSAEERAVFEADLETDADLREEWEMQRKVKELMKGQRRMDLEERMRRIVAEEEESEGTGMGVVEDQGEMEAGGGETPVRRIGWQRWLAAAAVALLAVGVPLWFLMNGGAEPQALFEENFGIYAAGGTNRLPDNPKPLDYGLDHYFKEEYAKAIPYFEAVQPGDSLYARHRIYLGVSYLGTGKSAKALAVFEATLKQADGTFHESAGWYSVLCYLQMKDVEKAKVELKKYLQTGTEFKRAEAEAILEAL